MAQHEVLNNKSHAELRVLVDANAELGDAVMGCFTIPSEFRSVQGHFPIVFRRNLEDDSFGALAMFGFTDGENLFLVDDKWDADYKPLAQSIQPFLVGRSADGEGPGQVHINMEHPRVSTSEEGVRLFDEDGQATPYLEQIAEKLGALDAGFRESGAFYEALQEYELLEPFTLEVPLADGSKNSLVGYHIINEDKLRELDGAVLGKLHSEGHLMPIFMALASMSQFGELIKRKNQQVTEV